MKGVIIELEGASGAPPRPPARYAEVRPERSEDQLLRQCFLSW
jgi:hypothetical protein